MSALTAFGGRPVDVTVVVEEGVARLGVLIA